MSSFYDNMAATALRLIKQYGQTNTLARFTPTNSPGTGTVVKGAATLSGPVTFMVLPASKDKDQTTEPGSLVVKMDHYIKMAAKGAPFVPRTDDELTFEGVQWQVVGATSVNPGGTPLVYGFGVVRL